MRYNKLTEGVFLRRPNRFLAHVLVDGREEICHVKNTGRLKELLLPQARVLVEKSDNPKRKTRYSLICVWFQGGWVNIDSQAPNQLAEEFVASGRFLGDVLSVRREFSVGDSRFDLYVETESDRWLIEVKGVTLVTDGLAMFPDAPTERGLKHVRELAGLLDQGYRTSVLFLIEREDAEAFTAHRLRQPAFARALKEAHEAGVRVEAWLCRVDREELAVTDPVPVLF